MNKAQVEAAALNKGLPMRVAAGGCKSRLLASCGFPMILFGSRSQRQERQSLEPYMKLHLFRQDLQDYQDFFVLVGSATVPTIFPGTR